MTGLTLTTRSSPAGHVMSLHGELDVATAPQLREACAALVHTAGQELVLDLGELAFCDSSGISAFIAARNLADSFGATFALAATPPAVARMFAITGLSEYFTCYDTADQRHRD